MLFLLVSCVLFGFAGEQTMHFDEYNHASIGHDRQSGSLYFTNTFSIEMWRMRLGDGNEK